MKTAETTHLDAMNKFKGAGRQPEGEAGMVKISLPIGTPVITPAQLNRESINQMVMASAQPAGLLAGATPEIMAAVAQLVVTMMNVAGVIPEVNAGSASSQVPAVNAPQGSMPGGSSGAHQTAPTNRPPKPPSEEEMKIDEGGRGNKEKRDQRPTESEFPLGEAPPKEQKPDEDGL